MLVKQCKDFFALFGAPKNVVEYLRLSVVPKFRHFDGGHENPHWKVHKTHIVQALQLAHGQGHRVEYRGCSPEYLDLFEKTTANRDNKQPVTNKEQAYAALYLTADAPTAIVDAAWKVLAKMHHPDVGGDALTFTRISGAYDLIKKG
jgi:hypothetical protein